jgi:small subunit ribosomal protein S1
MGENFAELFEESLIGKNLISGAIVKGKVVFINNENVVVNAGLKSEGVIPVSEFFNEQGTLDIKVGDEVDVALDKLEDGFGETILSRDKAKAAESWLRLIKSHEDKETVKGTISGKVKGGFTVDLEEVKAFLPGSLIDVRPLRDTAHLENKELDFKIIKVDQKRNNIVVSRRAVIEEESGAEREALLETIEEGQELKGIVKNLTDYGAFIDLGGIDGLLHITDMSWKRVKHPSEMLNVGDEIDVKILKYDQEKGRVSLGIKQLSSDPWADLAARYQVGSRLQGKVTTLTDYGCFVEIENGVEGLVHMSEMDWTNKNITPSKVVSIDQDVEVMVLEIDEDRRRFSLGLKQCLSNPWDDFSTNQHVGDVVQGKIKSITDFGVFIGLPGGIDGLIHLSDLSWDDNGEEAVREYQKGQDIDAVILAIDSERERISLGVKQMTDNHFATYLDTHPRGTIVNGVITEVDENIALVNLGEEVIGQIKANDISEESVSDARDHLRAGEEVQAKIMGIDKKSRNINLSIRAKDHQDQREALKELKQSSTANATLGDLFKDKMNKDD